MNMLSNNVRILLLIDASKQKNIDLIHQIANLGWQVILVSHQPSMNTISSKILFRRIHLPIVYPLSYLAFFEFAMITLRLKPTIIHAFNLSDYGVLAGLARRFLLCRSVLVSATGKDIKEDAFTLRGWSVKHILNLVEETTCDDNMAKAAALQLGTPINRLNLIPDAESKVIVFDAIYRKLLTTSRKD